MDGTEFENELAEPRMLLKVLFPAIALLLLTAAFVVTKTARDALYIQDGGVRAMPMAFVLIAILSVPQAHLVLKSMARIGPRATRVLLPTIVCVCILLYYPFATHGSALINDVFLHCGASHLLCPFLGDLAAHL